MTLNDRLKIMQFYLHYFLVKWSTIIYHKPSWFNPCSTKRKGQIIVLVIHVMHILLFPSFGNILKRKNKYQMYTKTYCITQRWVMCIYSPFKHTLKSSHSLYNFSFLSPCTLSAYKHSLLHPWYCCLSLVHLVW